MVVDSSLLCWNTNGETISPACHCGTKALLSKPIHYGVAREVVVKCKMGIRRPNFARAHLLVERRYREFSECQSVGALGWTGAGPIQLMGEVSRLWVAALGPMSQFGPELVQADS